MRRRLMLAFVGLVAGVLVIAGAGSLILTRNAARHQATTQLAAEAQSLTTGGGSKRSLAELRVIRRVLELEDARLIRVNVLGVVASPLPSGVAAADIDPTQLLNGQSVSGRQGSLVFAAAPVHLTTAERVRLKLRGEIVVLLTRQVGDLGPSWGYFIVAGGVALLIAALVAWQMSRRMSRPIIEAMQATGRIASGDLGTRLPVRDGDYSEFTSLTRSINEMAQSIESGRLRERHLLLSVSHDLRTPLTSIRGFAEAIQDGAIDDNAHAAQVIIAESRRLERLVGDLLDLTKLEARQLSISVRPTDLAEVVGITAEGFRPLAEKSGLHLSITTPPDGVCRAVVDPDRMAQILANLVENAITFARSSVSIFLTPPVAGDLTGPNLITVEDDGPGVAPADIGRVFERFYQADRGPNRKIGSGLGLAIVAELVSAMGAGVRVESPTGADSGSRFVVSVPQPANAPVT
jgi:signal transduction histidine kinase